MDCGNGAEVVYLRTFHDHAATQLSGVQMLAAVEQDYTLLTGAGHTHALRITAAHFQTLQAFGTVTLTSDPTGIGHVHQVEITC